MLRACCVFLLFSSVALARGGGALVVRSLDSDALDGSWTVRNANSTLKVAVKVPGGIYTDLERGGVLQDVLYRFHDQEYRWVARENWTYTRLFDVDRGLLARNYVSLVLEGLDTFAEVLVNGERVGGGDNMFVRYAFPVKHALVEGGNVLEVRFASPISVAEQRHDVQARDYVVPPLCVPKEYHGECHVNMIRKMQASFAWDWGPAFPSVGIWKSVRLEAYDAAVLLGVTVATVDNGTHWLLRLNATWTAGLAARSTLHGKVAVRGKLFLCSSTVFLTGSRDRGQCSMDIPKEDVELWWPNGFGAQPLYNATVRLTTGSMHSNVIKIRIGFRTVELVEDPVSPGNDSLGLTFYVRVNGVPIFAKGSNWIPASILPERLAKEGVLRRLLGACRDTHMNMLRVWGGGVYESDLFYDLADEIGILIWQDMMFACSMYPVDEMFLDSVSHEVKHNVLRLQHHPSIALWAGNNENEAALRGNWYGTAGNYSRYHLDYVKLYVDTVRTLVLSEDDTRPYVVSSPSNGKQSEKEGYVSQHPYSALYGDTHYYNYLADGWDPNIYPRTRFASEYGFQALPSLEGLAQASLPTDWTIHSNFSESRQHHPGGYAEMIFEIKRQFNFSSEDTAENFPSFIYLSQVNQAMSVKAETEGYRRYRGVLSDNGEGLTMGALYWQLNDVWQAPSWASIQLDGTWKMLHYFAKDFFSPVLASPYILPDGRFQVSLISDLLHDIPHIMINTDVYPWDSFSPKYSWSQNFPLRNSTAHVVFGADLQEFLADAGCGSDVVEARKRCFLYLTLFTYEGGEVRKLGPDNFLLLSSLKSATGMQRANVTVTSVTAADPCYDIELRTDGIALFVWLEAHGLPGVFSENGFLMVTRTRAVRFCADRPGVSARQLLRKLTVTSLSDHVTV